MIHVNILTPDETIYKGEATSLTLPTADGEITVLPGHIPLISILAAGTIVLRTGTEEHLYAVSRGVIEVGKDSIRILAQTADPASRLQEEAIEMAKAKAEDLMTNRRHDTEGFAEATALLERELARLKTVRRYRSRALRGTLPPQ